MNAQELAKEIVEDVLSNLLLVGSKEIAIQSAVAKLEPLVSDAERLRFIEVYHAKGGSLHMDGTDVFVLGGSLGRARTFREAVDAKMKHHEWRESEAT